MATRTLVLMRQDVRNKADAPSANFPTDAELTRDLNVSARKLYDLLLDAGYQEPFLASATIPIVSGTDAYALPDGTLYTAAPRFYRALGVDLSLGTRKVALRPFNFTERNQFIPGGWLPDVASYRIMGGNIRFIPVPTTSRTVTLWYAPLLTDMSGDSDTLEGFNGFEEFAVLDCAIKYCNKSRLDAMGFLQQLQMETERIQSAISKRDQSSTQAVTDVTTMDIDPYWRVF